MRVYHSYVRRRRRASSVSGTAAAAGPEYNNPDDADADDVLALRGERRELVLGGSSPAPSDPAGRAHIGVPPKTN